jgi:ribosomal-protein-alanine N-acetyltransferase
MAGGSAPWRFRLPAERFSRAMAGDHRQSAAVARDEEGVMFIRTDRLFLRPAWPEDIGELLAVLSDDAVVRSIGVSALPRTPTELRGYLERPGEILLPHFCINLRESDGAKLIGVVGLGRNGDEVELGCRIALGHHGHGYAAEAVRGVLADAQMLGHRQVVAAHFSDNEASARVLKQAGFTPTGETRSRYSYRRRAQLPASLYIARLAS